MLRDLGSVTLPAQSVCRRSGCGNGSARNNVAFATLKMVVLAPMPSARVRMAIAVNPGFLVHSRTAYRTSIHTLPIRSPPAGPDPASPRPPDGPQVLSRFGRKTSMPGTRRREDVRLWNGAVPRTDGQPIAARVLVFRHDGGQPSSRSDDNVRSVRARRLT